MKKNLISIFLALFQLSLFGQNLNDSLIICMPMGTNASDFSGKMNHGVISGSLSSVTGHDGTPGSAYRFNGAQYIRIPTSPSIDRIEQYDELSISVWCRVNSWSPVNRVFPVLERYYPATNDGWAFDLNQGNFVNPSSPNDINFINSVYASTKWDCGAVGSVQTGTASPWQHYVLVYSKSGNFCRIYVNGQSVANHTPLTNNTLYNTNNGDLIIGYSPAGDIEWAYGDIDNLKVYNRALSGTEANMLFKETITCASTGTHTSILPEIANNTIILNQNTPNPFTEKTVITYEIPFDFIKAQIVFINSNGLVIKTVDIKEKGQGTLSNFANDFNQGLFAYTLIIDGKTVVTKKMLKQ